MKPSRVFSAALAVTALGVGVLAAPADAASSPRVTVLVSGLHSPRHLEIDPAGHLYVAEAGVGDPTKTNCIDAIGETGAATQKCVGKTGAILRIDGHRATAVLRGIESSQEVDNNEVLGVADLTWSHGTLKLLMQSSEVQHDGSTTLPGADEFGKVVTTAPHSPRSTWGLGPDLAAFAAEHPQRTIGGLPGETAYDSDPYALTPYKGGYAVADAAANSLVWISPAGKLFLLARFPSVAETVPAGVLGPTALTIQAQAVPTSVAVGPDGALYVGGLRGVPSLPGTADVYRVVPGHAPKVWATGFSAITDLAFDNQHGLLVLEYNQGGLLSPPTVSGALIRVNRNHSRTTLVSSGLTAPTGLAVGRRGAVYIADSGASGSASGRVLKVTG